MASSSARRSTHGLRTSWSRLDRSTSNTISVTGTAASSKQVRRESDGLGRGRGGRVPRDRLHGCSHCITSRRRSATEDLIARRGWSGLEPETVWEMPTILIGSPRQIRADLQARRERFGLSYLVTPDANLPILAEIIRGL